VVIFGLWLVHVAGYNFGDGWVIGALVLFALSNALGGVGGSRDKATRQLAERLAASGDQPSAELRARLRDPLSLALSYGAGLTAFAVLALMIWKPGAGGFLAGLSVLYLIALGVAWFAMTAKPGGSG
jgi:Predicted integral membrane protein (DUF2269).